MGLIINRMILNKLVKEHEMLINVVQAYNNQNPNEPLPEPSQAEFLLLNYHITKMTAEDGMCQASTNWSLKLTLIWSHSN